MKNNKHSNKEFGNELEKRTRIFAGKIIDYSASLPSTPESRVVRMQLTKAGTSIGANYREANRGRSRADFKNKICIAEAEASETRYWLEIIRDTDWINKDDDIWIYNECCELLAIFTSIGKGLQ